MIKIVWCVILFDKVIVPQNDHWNKDQYILREISFFPMVPKFEVLTYRFPAHVGCFSFYQYYCLGGEMRWLSQHTEAKVRNEDWSTHGIQRKGT